MKLRLLRLWKSLDEDSNRTLSESEKRLVLEQAEDRKSEWNELSTTLRKWLFATLITLHLGTIAFTINLNIHPDALSYVTRILFLGLMFTIAAAYVEIRKIDQLNKFVVRLKYDHTNADPPTQFELRHHLSNIDNFNMSITLVSFSMFSFFMAGLALADSTRRCTIEDLEFSIDRGSNEAPGPKGQTRRCYYYEINGMPSDPLERAIFETKLIARIKLEKGDGK